MDMYLVIIFTKLNNFMHSIKIMHLQFVTDFILLLTS